MNREYLMRSLMFVPAHDKRLLGYAAKTDADILLLDIEDSAQPAVNKQIARDNIIDTIKANTFKDRLLFPRVNDRESGHILKDIYQLTIEGITGFMYPKVKNAEDIYSFSKLLEAIEFEKKIALNTFKIIALIETTSAIMNIQDICKICPERLVAVAFGGEDFAVDLDGGYGRNNNSDFFFTAKSMITMAARANNVIPIDTVHINVHDLKELEQNLIMSKKLGFEGMLVLNPKELPFVHKYYSPSQDDVKWAKEIIFLSEEIAKQGQGVAIKDGEFIGPPIMKKAEKILKKQRLIDETKQLKWVQS